MSKAIINIINFARGCEPRDPNVDLVGTLREELELVKKYNLTVVIGDRCYTDIASGNNAGVDTVCVLSGEVTLEEVNEVQGAEKPTFLLNHVKELL